MAGALASGSPGAEPICILSSAPAIPVASAPVATAKAEAKAASAKAASAKAAAVPTRTSEPRNYRAVIAARALLETACSLRSFDTWRTALLGDERGALESRAQCRRLVATMAQYEKELTQRLLKEGAVFRLQADGRDRHRIVVGARHSEGLPLSRGASGVAGGVGPTWPLDCRADHRHAGIPSADGLRRQG